MRATSPILAVAVCALFGAALPAADSATAPAVVEVSLSTVPAPVLATMKQSSGGNGFSIITQSTAADGTVTYAGTFTKDGKKSVVTVSAIGTLISVTDAN